MPITINGSGTVTGITAGGLPDGVITTDDIAADAVTSAKIASGAIVDADVNASAAIADSKLTGTTCKAWVNFNGTGTVAIRASYNVSSITDNGTGDYTVNFTTALADANYSFAGMAQYDTTGGGDRRIGVSRTANAIASGSARINTLDGSGSNADFLVVAFVVFR
jgi:hypothetical protein